MIVDRYSSRVESRGILDNALVIVHKSKLITVKDVKGVLTYSVRVEKPPTPQPHLEWTRNNYPYPLKCEHCVGKLCAECFPFYTPEEDTILSIKEKLYMTRDKYKALSQGKTFIPKKKPYQYAQK